MAEGKGMTVTLMQLQNESVEKSGFKYVVALSGGHLTRHKALAFSSLYELFEIVGGYIEIDLWKEIEASLAKDKVWKKEDTDLANLVLRRC